VERHNDQEHARKRTVCATHLRGGCGGCGAECGCRAWREVIYEIWAWDTRKTTRRKAWDEGAGEFKSRYSYAPRPREEWLFVRVSDAGILREVVEDTRQSLKEITRASPPRWPNASGSSPAGYCAVASAATPSRPHTPAREVANRFTTTAAARATTPGRAGTAPTGNTCQRVEEQVWNFVRDLLRHPERIRVGSTG
jgi:hypothetical protein